MCCRTGLLKRYSRFLLGRKKAQQRSDLTKDRQQVFSGTRTAQWPGLADWQWLSELSHYCPNHKQRAESLSKVRVVSPVTNRDVDQKPFKGLKLKRKGWCHVTLLSPSCFSTTCLARNVCICAVLCECVDMYFNWWLFSKYKVKWTDW